MKRFVINTSIAVILGLGIGLALVWAWRGGSVPAVAAPVLSLAEGPRAEEPTDAPSSPTDELHVCFGGCLYSSIQDAVDAANDGDVIKVAIGVYTGVQGRLAPPGYGFPPASGLITQVVYITKTVVVRGGYTIENWTTPDPKNNPTTLDAQGQGRVLLIAGDITPTIEGLRITAGDASGLGGHPGGRWGEHDDSFGGGVYINATTTFRDNQVFNNTAEQGGGLWLLGSETALSRNTIRDNTGVFGGGLSLTWSNATLSDNTITDNAALLGGGGLYLQGGDVILSGNTIISNTADGGGGLFLWRNDARLNGNTVISNTASGSGGGLWLAESAATLSGNTVSNNTTDGSGGGVSLDEGSAATLNGNTITNNLAGSNGGGLHLLFSPATLSGNTITNNAADGSGGGVSLEWESDATLINNVVTDNQVNDQGSGLYVGVSSTRLLHNTIARNHGGDGAAIYIFGYSGYPSTVVLTNTILVSHNVGINVTGGTPSQSTAFSGKTPLSPSHSLSHRL